MPSTRKPAKKTQTPTTAASVLASLRGMANKQIRESMGRYGIPSHNALGISVGALRKLGKQLGRDHALALALWDTGVYEARMLTAFVGEPERLTPAQMDRFCRDFDNWAITDTLCFDLFDRTPHAFSKIKAWSKRRPEFEKRAAFALLASVALHDKAASNQAFLETLPLIERASDDERNFVKKGVSWALRGVGSRNLELHEAAIALATKLAGSNGASARFIGKDALRDLSRPLVAKKLAKRR